MSDKKIKKTRVFLSRMRAVTALGQGISILMQALLTSSCYFTRSHRFPSSSFSVIAAELNDFVFEKALSTFTALPKNLISNALKAGRRAPLTIRTSLIATLEAWQQAELHYRIIDKTCIDVIIAGQNTTQAYQYNLHSPRLKGLHNETIRDLKQYFRKLWLIHKADTYFMRKNAAKNDLDNEIKHFYEVTVCT